MRKYVRMVPPPIEVNSKWVPSSFAAIPPNPPADTSATGSSTNRMPTVLITNCAMSVSVIDHMPPSTEYTTTIEPPMAMPAQPGSKRGP